MEFMISAHPTTYSFIEVEVIGCYHEIVSIVNASVWQMDEDHMWSPIKKRHHSALECTSDAGAYFNYHNEQLSSVAIFPRLKDRRGYHVMLCL